MKNDAEHKKSGLSASFVTGAVALVFLVVGYQTALFVNRAAVSKIMSIRETPDTVFVVDEAVTVRKEVDDAMSVGKETDDVRQTIRKQGSHTSVISHPRTLNSPRSYGYGGPSKPPRKVENFRFNPNEAAVSDLVRLGFSQKQAESIDNYRKKGGRFRRKTDFAKSYVVSDSVYRRLEPYIDIPLIDLNTADSAAFDSLPGIGGYFASRMVSYRERLCGYSYKEQLMDIYRFDREKFDALEDLIEIRSETVRPYPLWTLPEEELRLHPYIGSYSARGIVLYRENNPRTEWTIDNLTSAGVLKPAEASKLSRCLIAE